MGAVRSYLLFSLYQLLVCVVVNLVSDVQLLVPGGESEYTVDHVYSPMPLMAFSTLFYCIYLWCSWCVAWVWVGYQIYYS